MNAYGPQIELDLDHCNEEKVINGHRWYCIAPFHGDNAHYLVKLVGA